MEQKKNRKEEDYLEYVKSISGLVEESYACNLEYAKHMKVRGARCSFCPHKNEGKYICPAGINDKEDSQCNFVLKWCGIMGRKFEVRRDLSGNYRAYIHGDISKMGSTWKKMQQLKDRKSFDEAQEDLNRLAQKEGWVPYCIKSKLHIMMMKNANGNKIHLGSPAGGKGFPAGFKEKND